MQSIQTFAARNPNAEFILTAILVACAFMLFMLVRALLESRSSVAQATACQEEFMRMNETVSLIQSRIGISHRKLEALSTLARTAEPSIQDGIETDDFRDRLSR